MNRCEWAQAEQMISYHDAEWGVPIHDDRTLFEFLILEGAQAGLSWSTILKKREAYRLAFDGFDPAKVAAYDDAKVAELLANPGIVRNRLKIAAAITNAQAFIRIQAEFARTGGSAVSTRTSGASSAASRSRTRGARCASCPPPPPNRTR